MRFETKTPAYEVAAQAAVEEWIPQPESFCPKCGIQGSVHERGSTRFANGGLGLDHGHACTACGIFFRLTIDHIESASQRHQQRLVALREQPVLNKFNNA